MDDGKTLHFEIATTPHRNGSANGGTNGSASNGTTHTHKAPKPEKLMRLLSDRNLKLLKMIKTAEPKTLAELSRMSGRPKASLTRTIARLSDLGIVVLVKSRGRGKIPKVACDKVCLEVSLLPDRDATSAS
ncbi:MAG: helix-turn-helix domain-containing protein [Hyphomicrobium sp.]|nr:helix-turn-helix domain-containing protein [Hyphomicrobium sp.]